MTVPWRKLKQSIQETISKYDNVLLMVSGGVDSMFLLDFIQKNVDAKISVVHFRHGIRDDDHQEEFLVRSYCEKYNIDYKCGEGQNLKDIRNQECQARIQRWSFVESIISTLDGSTVVLTAHHLDDQIEHFFLSCTRGRSIRSLVMRDLTNFDDYDKYKPLLKISKDEIYKQANSRKIPYIEDPTNQSLDCERNLFRNKIIPEMMGVRNLKRAMPKLFEQIASQE